jgi:hypothetical protein
LNMIIFYYLHPIIGLFYQKRSETEYRLYIPNIIKIDKDDLQSLLIDHIYHILGHFGVKKILDIMNRYFYWKSLMEDIIHHIKSYHDYQINKSTSTTRKGLLRSLPVSPGSWLIITMDFLTGLPISINDSG